LVSRAGIEPTTYGLKVIANMFALPAAFSMR